MALGVIWYVVTAMIFIAQFGAFFTGTELWFGWGFWISLIVMFVAYLLQPLGLLFTIPVVFYGARYGWHWELWQATLIAAPNIVFGIILMVVASVAGIFEQRAERKAYEATIYGDDVKTPLWRRAVRALGLIYLSLAGLFIVLVYVFTIYHDGVSRFMEIANPLNVFNFIAIVITLAPGLFFLWLGEPKRHSAVNRRP